MCPGCGRERNPSTGSTKIATQRVCVYEKEREKDRERSIKQKGERSKVNQSSPELIQLWILMWGFHLVRRGHGERVLVLMTDGWWGPRRWSCDNELWVSEEEAFYLRSRNAILRTNRRLMHHCSFL